MLLLTIDISKDVIFKEKKNCLAFSIWKCFIIIIIFIKINSGIM